MNYRDQCSKLERENAELRRTFKRASNRLPKHPHVAKAILDHAGISIEQLFATKFKAKITNQQLHDSLCAGALVAGKGGEI